MFCRAGPPSKPWRDQAAVFDSQSLSSPAEDGSAEKRRIARRCQPLIGGANIYDKALADYTEAIRINPHDGTALATVPRTGPSNEKTNDRSAITATRFGSIPAILWQCWAEADAGKR